MSTNDVVVAFQIESGDLISSAAAERIRTAPFALSTERTARGVLKLLVVANETPIDAALRRDESRLEGHRVELRREIETEEAIIHRSRKVMKSGSERVTDP